MSINFAIRIINNLFMARTRLIHGACQPISNVNFHFTNKKSSSSSFDFSSYFVVCLRTTLSPTYHRVCVRESSQLFNNSLSIQTFWRPIWERKILPLSVFFFFPSPTIEVVDNEIFTQNILSSFFQQTPSCVYFLKSSVFGIHNMSKWVSDQGDVGVIYSSFLSHKMFCFCFI